VSAIAVVAGLGLVILILFVKDARRRHAEESLRLSEAKYRATLAALPDAVVILDSAGVIRECHARNASAPFRPGDALDKPLQDVLPADPAAKITRWIAGDDDWQAAIFEYSQEVGGTPHEFEARLVRCRGDEILTIVRDVTDKKRLERAFREREASLREKSRAGRSFAQRLIAAQEAERRRIARDLHDDLSQKLALLNIEIDTMAAGGAVDWHRQERRFHGLSNLVAEIARDVHDLSHELHPSKLGSLGLVAAIEGLCRDISRRHGIVVDFHHGGDSSFPDEPASLHLYRIAQEALHNVVKHSAAKEVLVELQIGQDALELRIVDDGCGFVPAARTQEGLGLTSMRERVKIVGGQIAIQSTPGMGTRLGVRLPSRVDRHWPDASQAVANPSPAEIA
jgi:signal transduction histidine kinase